MAKRIRWTRADQARALKEGWALFNMDTTSPSIQKDDEAGKFSSDWDARLHVIRRGAQGSEFHRKALVCLGLAMAKARA